MNDRSWKLVLDHLLTKTGALVKENTTYLTGSQAVLRRLADANDLEEGVDRGAAFSQLTVDRFVGYLSERGYEFGRPLR